MRRKHGRTIPAENGPPSPPRRTFVKVLVLVLLGVGAFGVTYALVIGSRPSPPDGPSGMVWVPGGEFTMGSDASYASAAEKPAHRVRLDGFWMDPTDVTNSQF